MKESPYFKEYEFECRCGKCKLPANVPSDELIDILTEIREHFGQCLRINSGYRCPEHNKRVGGASQSQHCYSEDTEILTNNGWKTYKTINPKKDKAFTLNFDRGKIELCKIDDFICYNVKKAKMYNFQNAYNDILVTDKHRIIHKLRADYNSKEWNIDFAKNIENRRFKLIQAGFNDNESKKSLKFEYACVAILSKGRIDSFNRIIFDLYNDCSLYHIQRVFENINISLYKESLKGSYTRLEIPEKDTKQFIKLLTKNNIIPLQEWLKLSVDNIRQLIREFDYYLGENPDNKSYRLRMINSENRINLQTLACVVGWTTINHEQTNKVSIFEKDISEIRDYSPSIITYTGKVWCISTENETLISKRNNKISIQGNCIGSAADFVVFKVPTEEVYKYVIEKYGDRELGIAIKKNPTNPYAGFVHIDTRGKKARWEYK